MSARKDGDIRTNTIQKLITLVVHTQLHWFVQSMETLNATRLNLIDKEVLAAKFVRATKKRIAMK